MKVQEYDDITKGPWLPEEVSEKGRAGGRNCPVPKKNERATARPTRSWGTRAPHLPLMCLF